MAAPKHHPRKGRRNKRSSSFLCSFGACFGFSSKVSADHRDGKPFSGRQRIAALPVNDRSAPAEVATSSKEIHVVENDQEKTTSPSADGFVTIKREEKTLEKSKRREQAVSPIAKRGEKEKQNNTGHHDTWTKQPKLSHSVSLPLPHQKKEITAVAGEKKGKSGNEIAVVDGGEIDSMVGAGIIMVTLVVMVIWGKVCAILCTAAWLYFIPRFRANQDRSYAAGETHRLDFDSREYKKRVVLQGLLDRNPTHE